MAIERVERGKNHHYKIDGVKADGVTTVIGKGMPKPALPYWAARSVAEYVIDAEAAHLVELRSMNRDKAVQKLKQVPWKIRDDAAERGTDVHHLADQLVTGADVDVPDDLVGYVDAAVNFMNTWQPQPVLTETVVASRRWNYAGTFDLVADLPDGRRVLFDYKTSRSGIWPETALQLAAYRYADCYLGTDGTEMPMQEIGIDECMAVWLRPDGYDVVPLDTSEAVHRAFLHVQYVARVSDLMKDWVKPAVYL